MRRALAACVLMAGLCGGCSPGEEASALSARVERGASGGPASEAAGPEAIIAGEPEGLEVHWWLADDSDGAVGAVLAAAGQDALPAGDAAGERWESSGLRLVRVPMDRWEAVSLGLVPLNRRTKEWVGWSPGWREVFRGRRVGGAQPITMEGERVSLPRGIARMLLRCWPVVPPNLDARRGEIRVELAIQLLPPPEVKSVDLLSPVELGAVEDQGPILRRLTLSTLLDPASVYVVTSETPGVTWTPKKDPLLESPGASDGPEASAGELEALAGPPSSGARSLGEAAMSARASETKNRAAKAVLVIVPRGGRRYQLLP